MLTKAKAKYLRSLTQKKFRKTHLQFVVEGEKSVLELFNSDFSIKEVYATDKFTSSHKDKIKCEELIIVKQDELNGIGSFATNNSVIALCDCKDIDFLRIENGEYALVLDDVRDPGNLGTIIRIADWYGIKIIYCSHSCVDFYNPKVIQSTMGSFTRVNLIYVDLEEFLEGKENVYAAVLSGENVHDTNFSKDGGYILMGNESHGVNESLLKKGFQKITIPCYGHTESLNVGMATAVICDNLRRRIS